MGLGYVNKTDNWCYPSHVYSSNFGGLDESSIYVWKSIDNFENSNVFAEFSIHQMSHLSSNHLIIEYSSLYNFLLTVYPPSSNPESADVFQQHRVLDKSSSLVLHLHEIEIVVHVRDSYLKMILQLFHILVNTACPFSFTYLFISSI